MGSDGSQPLELNLQTSPLPGATALHPSTAHEGGSAPLTVSAQTRLPPPVPDVAAAGEEGAGPVRASLAGPAPFAYYWRVYELCSHHGTSRGIGCNMQALKSVFIFVSY